MAAFEAIASTTLGSNATTVTFSSIPATYEHLQVRVFARLTWNTTQTNMNLVINSDSASNYVTHNLYGNGGSVTASGVINYTFWPIEKFPGLAATSNVFGCAVIDILDYATSNKFKTIRGISGVDRNGGGEVHLSSGLWRSTAAVTSLQFGVSSDQLAAGSVFSLYGLRSA